MFQNKKVVVVMPAYNAEKTLLKTYEEVMAQGIVDLVVFVDDASSDNTAKIAAGLPQTKLFVHEKNLRLWRQPENLLPAGAGRRRGYCNYGASRLSIHAEADSGDGLINRKRSLSLRAWFPHPGRLCPERRHAVLEIYCQPFFDS